MRILHVIADMDPLKGGVGQAIRTMIAGLQQLNIENEVVCLNEPSADFLKKDPFPVHTPGEGKGFWIYNPDFKKWLIKNLLHFDCVIVHGLWLYNGYATNTAMKQLIRKAGSNKKLPKLFVMPHGMLDPYFQKATGRKLKALRNIAYWKMIEASLVNNADGLLFTCESERVLARIPFKPYHPKRELVVGLGVEKPEAYVDNMLSSFIEKCPGTNGHPYFLFLSRVHEKKGVDLLINAYIRVIEKKQNAASIPNLVIAGPGLETAYGQKMQQLAAACVEKDKIFFTGMLAGAAKYGAFYGSEAFILPSHQENFGIAVVEALACGKPVLISNQVNIWSEIIDSGGGIVANDTLEGTVQLLEEWLSFSAEEKKQKGICAKQVYQKFFAMDTATERLLNGLNQQ